MDRLAEQRTSQLGGSLAAPRVAILIAVSPPGHIDVKNERLAGELLVDQVFEFLQAVTKTILKYWHHQAAAFACQAGNEIHCRHTPNQGFFTNHVFARFECGLDLAGMKRWWCTNIDHVDIRPPADLVKAVANFLDTVFFGYRCGALNLDVTQHYDSKELG
jgi:hypothetical protein